MSAEYVILRKHTLKILCKSKHFPRRYKRKGEWVFFSEHSVVTFAVSLTVSEIHAILMIVGRERQTDGFTMTN